MILSIEGEPKTGKTSLALTAPLPIVMFSFDLGVERAIYGTAFDKHFKDLNIVIVPYGSKPVTDPADITIYMLPEPIQLNSDLNEGYVPLWEYFITRFGAAIQNPNVQTIVLDTATLTRRVKAEAYLEQLQKDAIKEKQAPRRNLLQIEWGNANTATKQLYAAAAATGKNLIATHHLRDKYVSQIGRDGKKEQVPDGTLELEGLGDTYKSIDIGVRNEVIREKVVSEIVVCGILELVGMKIEDPTWDKFAKLYMGKTGGRIKVATRE